MIEEGAQAPTFELPGIREGSFERVDTEQVFGSGGVVVLAFYPGDFNPACSGTETGLDELDLFTLQKDVTVLAISGDSVHSHRAFAAEFNLEMTLLSDLRGEVARQYGVTADDEMAGHLTKRAVFVVDHRGVIQYAWATDDPEALPDVDAVREAVQGVGDDDTARSRYRVGHARYMEGRRAFTSAMGAYEDREWMMAQSDFAQAAEEFDAAAEEFNTAVRFSEGETGRTYFERGEEKAEALWRASEWLSESASAFASGSGRKAESLRSDAEKPLQTVRDLHEPPDPDGFPPEEDPADATESEAETDRAWLDDEEETDASLAADIDAELAEADEDAAADAETAASDEHADAPADSAPPDEDPTAPDEGPTPPSGDASAEAGEEPTTTADDSDDAAIDDEELEEITAELEEQTEAAQTDNEESEPEPGGGNVVPQDIDDDGRSAATQPAASDAEATSDDGQTETADQMAADAETDPADDAASQEDEEIELELTDPTESEDGDDGDESESDDEDDASDEPIGGDHGVPDSL